MIVEIRWKGPERELPTFGVVHPGDRIPLPAHVANQYIAQGEAEEVRAAPSAKTKSEKED